MKWKYEEICSVELVSRITRVHEKKKREEETKLGRDGERERERKKEKIVDFIDRE